MCRGEKEIRIQRKPRQKKERYGTYGRNTENAPQRMD